MQDAALAAVDGLAVPVGCTARRVEELGQFELRLWCYMPLVLE